MLDVTSLVKELVDGYDRARVQSNECLCNKRPSAKFNYGGNFTTKSPKFCCFMLACLLLLSIPSFMARSCSASDLYALAYYTPKPILIDGNLSDQAWQDVAWSDQVDARGFKTSAKIRWDDEFLYLGVIFEEPIEWQNISATPFCNVGFQHPLITSDEFDQLTENSKSFAHEHSISVVRNFCLAKREDENSSAYMFGPGMFKALSFCETHLDPTHDGLVLPRWQVEVAIPLDQLDRYKRIGEGQVLIKACTREQQKKTEEKKRVYPGVDPWVGASTVGFLIMRGRWNRLRAIGKVFHQNSRDVVIGSKICYSFVRPVKGCLYRAEIPAEVASAHHCSHALLSSFVRGVFDPHGARSTLLQHSISTQDQQVFLWLPVWCIGLRVLARVHQCTGIRGTQLVSRVRARTLLHSSSLLGVAHPAIIPCTSVEHADRDCCKTYRHVV